MVNWVVLGDSLDLAFKMWTQLDVGAITIPNTHQQILAVMKKVKIVLKQFKKQFLKKINHFLILSRKWSNIQPELNQRRSEDGYKKCL